MANIVKDRDKLYAKQLAQSKARSASGVAGIEMGNRIADAQDAGSPVIISGSAASTPSGYLAFNAANDARASRGQMPLGDANAARAAANIARSPDSGAMIPSDKVGQANMLASMPNQGSLTPFEQPTDTWIQRSRDFTQSRVGGTNQQLQMQRQEMGTNQSSTLSQQVAQLDPSIRKDAERAREWRIMSPQQRREEVDRLGMEQDARIAAQASAGTWEDRQKYARSLADPTGMFIDSYSRESPMYSPETAERIRYHQRKIEPAIARMMSSYDRTKWDSPQAYLDAASALPEVIEAGEFGKSIVFNIGRKYGTPTMKAQMEAEDRNMKLFEQAGTKKALEEIVQKMAQAGQVSPEYANGYRLTNDGTKELLRQVWLNKDNDPRAGQIVNEIMANAPVMWAEEGGRVVQDPAHQERRRVMLENQKTQAGIDAKKQERDDAIRAEHIKYSGIQKTNPEYAKNMQFNDVTGKYDDFNSIVPEKEETNWDEIYQNDARMSAAESTMSWSRFTDEAQAAEEAARQFPTRPDLPPTDPLNQKALLDQQQAVDIWRTQVNPPEKRAELEREMYNLKLRGQELRKGFKSPPAPEPTSGGYGLTMDSLGVGSQRQPVKSAPVSIRPPDQSTSQITLNSPAPIPGRPASNGAQVQKKVIELKVSGNAFAPTIDSNQQTEIDNSIGSSVPVHYWDKRTGGGDAKHGVALVPIEDLPEFLKSKGGANIPMISPSKPNSKEGWDSIRNSLIEAGIDPQDKTYENDGGMKVYPQMYSQWKSHVRKQWKTAIKDAKRA